MCVLPLVYVCTALKGSLYEVLQAGNAVAWTWSVPSFVSSRRLCHSCLLVSQLHCMPSETCLFAIHQVAPVCCSTLCWKSCLSAINRLLLLAAVTTKQHMLQGLSLLQLASCCSHNSAEYAYADASLAAVNGSTACESVEPEAGSLHRQKR